MSIVLVVIGLIIGGVLVGQDLIRAAAVRAQISQIEKYNTAANTFHGKYGYLPGDIPATYASQFGFATRGTDCNGAACAGEGNGDGLISAYTGFGGSACGLVPFYGENGQFWVDLSKAGLIDGGFSTSVISNAGFLPIASTKVSGFIPQAKIGSGYVYVWSGGWAAENGNGGCTKSDGVNYFGLQGVNGSSDGNGDNFFPNAVPNLSVAQAYNIDQKMDDGLPQSGNVTTIAPASFNNTVTWPAWASGTAPHSGDYSNAIGGPVTNTSDIGDGVTAGPNSCYDGSSGTVPEQYSMQINKGADVNCWLSFKFQ